MCWRLGLLRSLEDACRSLGPRSADDRVDNMSEVLSLTAGRARDAALNTICRRAAGLQLLSGVRLRRRHVATARNCADDDSRLADRGEILPGQVFFGDHPLEKHLHQTARHIERPAGLRLPGLTVL